MPEQEFTSLYDVMSHCNYVYSPCDCEDNLPITSERCGDASLCRVDEDFTGKFITFKNRKQIMVFTPESKVAGTVKVAHHQIGPVTSVTRALYYMEWLQSLLFH